MRTLLLQVVSVAARHQALEVLEIEVEIGPLSGVEPLLLQSAFGRLRGDFQAVPVDLLHSAVLRIGQVGLVVVCSHCGTESRLPDFHFRCPECQSGALTIIQGDCLRLMNVQLRIADHR